MTEIDDKQLEAVVVKTTYNVCNNLYTKFDDEYLSLAYVIAFDAIRTFDVAKSERGVYNYIRLCIYKTLRGFIIQEYHRRKALQPIDIDDRPEYHDTRQEEPIQADINKEAYTDLVVLNRTRTQYGNTRKRIEQTKAVMNRLRKKYGD